ncbi:M24 family metallopeptidase [Paramuribaculum intestinale]|uniref:M24 family metallopeptidase n=1 Tax=Paramuribaculum intestinale TaxID=2094151 RepID=UPI0025B6C1EF|nr:Xaa-Pro peptidase family protein [Paramuribaculum intestinale]
MKQLNILEPQEARLRFDNLRRLLEAEKADAALITDNANIYYLTGRVFDGYIYVALNGQEIYFVRRPIDLEGDGVVAIRKPEDMAQSIGLNMPQRLGMELDVTTWSVAERLKKAFEGAETINFSPAMRRLRSAKTPAEIEKIRQSGIRQERVYRRIPHLYREGMTDLELQVEIERISRLEGCLGQFRISGDSMELYMGNILVGENADTPTPYDFAMGGEGLDPSLPVGCNGTVIRPGDTVMVDVNGNYTGYMTDMTRTFIADHTSDLAAKAHQCSIEICHRMQTDARPGAEARSLYATAEAMAREAGLERYFMGHRQKAGFVGHGVGIEINEMPVIAPRSRDIIAPGNVIAFEPKFVIPGAGAVGIENTYCVGADRTECLTNAPEQFITLLA